MPQAEKLLREARGHAADQPLQTGPARPACDPAKTQGIQPDETPEGRAKMHGKLRRESLAEWRSGIREWICYYNGAEQISLFEGFQRAHQLARLIECT